jgi:hypothetical protein
VSKTRDQSRFGDDLAQFIDVRRDAHGLLLDHERIPKRVRPPRQPEGR